MATQAKSKPSNGQQAPAEQKKRPVEVIRRYVGGATIDVAIFEKKIEKRTATGVFTRVTYFVTVSKSWRKRQEEGYDGPAEWESGSAFNPHELLELASAVQQAHRRCIELQAAIPEEEPF